jgi:ribosome biogenesis protein Nip4
MHAQCSPPPPPAAGDATLPAASTCAVRPLTEEETKVVFEKLHKFIGKNIKALVERGDQPYCLRLQKNRVFYVREDIMRRATNVRM